MKIDHYNEDFQRILTSEKTLSLLYKDTGFENIDIISVGHLVGTALKIIFNELDLDIKKIKESDKTLSSIITEYTTISLLSNGIKMTSILQKDIMNQCVDVNLELIYNNKACQIHYNDDDLRSRGMEQLVQDIMLDIGTKVKALFGEKK